MNAPAAAPPQAHETHQVNRTGWLRAAVLGANDGILSVASIVCGIAAGGGEPKAVLLAGLAGLVAGATSMATGEYVSVSSQSDIETTDIAREQRELQKHPHHEHEELAQIYIGRGLDSALAREVATQLMDHDALDAHVRDELGIFEVKKARPLQAALASAASFTSGGIVPLIVAYGVPSGLETPSVIAISLIALAVLGALGAKMGSVKILRPTLRVLLWGALSLGLTILVGRIFRLEP